jgi:DEAD/DEAH box helicase domain-containing protein
MRLQEFVAALQSDPAYEGQIVARQRLAACPARYGELARPLTEPVRAALAGAGIERLYTHQTRAIDLARAGQHVTTVTATASGKSLCFNVPVAERMTERRGARALYLYPTKALAHDQLGKLDTLGLFTQLLPATYDGDTAADQRRLARRAARVLLTNPDMLHLSILPRHTAWATFLSSLEYVILDEVHTYRGVFGSHVAAVLRRLRRLCEHYGSNPRFLCTSATIGNPAQHVEHLTGIPTQIVDEDGSPHGERLFLLWNPPLLSALSGDRRSTNTEATLLLTALVRAGIRSIVFARARVVAELLLRYAQQELRGESPRLAASIASYRAGYTPGQRRDIERRLFGGELLAVTSTNALELGVDVGGLDAAVLVGYPGTIASTWQQAGRAGRVGQESLAILVAQDDPLDQFLVRHPEYLFGRNPERAALDPENPYVLLRHLVCAAYERPLGAADAALFGAELPEIAAVLTEARQLHHESDRWYWSGSGYPASEVDLRTSGGTPYAILHAGEENRLLGTADGTTALQVVYPGAVYLHQGESYLVERLDVAARTAYVRPADVDYYTVPRVNSSVRIERQLETATVGRTRAALGEVTVTSHVIGYRSQRLLTDRLITSVDLELPPTSYRTEGLWFVVPPAIQQAAPREGLDLLGTIHAIEHAAIGLAPLQVMCDRWDLGGVSNPNHPDTSLPSIFIYDGYPGGAGIAARCFDGLHALLRTTLATVRACPCEEGCPSCIQSPKCGSNNQPLDKRGAGWVLERLLEEYSVVSEEAGADWQEGVRMSGTDGP